MAYSVSNPPVCLTARIGSGPALWIYNSGDAHGTVSTGSYFSNGKKLGMKVGDHVIVGRTTGSSEASTIHFVKTVADGGVAIAAALLA